MPPLIALTLCCIFVLWLYVRDSRQYPEVSVAIYIPLIWLLIFASRPISQWLGMGQVVESPQAYLEGSPFDRNIFTALIGVGLFTLLRREVNWSDLLGRNKWIFSFFLYCGMSIMWSDFPVVTGKRWLKGIGALVMVLLVITDRDHLEALKALIRRWAYVLLPMSVVLIKYCVFSSSISCGITSLITSSTIDSRRVS